MEHRTRVTAGLGCATAVLASGGVLLLLTTIIAVPPLELFAADEQRGVCRLTIKNGTNKLSRRQLRNAEIIATVGRRMNVPTHGWVVALATAYQESRLRNLHHGDRDSLGLFQQRPSQGWGAPEQITDPRYAARQFYTHLLEVEGWQNMPLTLAAQAVQASAFPYAYADHTELARTLVAKVTGTDVSCPVPQTSGRNPDGSWAPEEMLPMGLTPRTKRVMELIERRFDAHEIGGFCEGGCTTGHVPGSDHYDGHAIDVMLTPYTSPAMERKGNRIARFLVANHERLAIKYVIWNDRIWQPEQGWQPYTHPSGNTSDPTLRHLDHVHVSVY